MNLNEGPIITQDCFTVRPQLPLKQIGAVSQKFEATTRLQAAKHYFDKRLDVRRGIVKEVGRK